MSIPFFLVTYAALFTIKDSSHDRLPLINHALATTLNSGLGGLTTAEFKFGTLDPKHFKMPQQLVPGHYHGLLVQQLDKNPAEYQSPIYFPSERNDKKALRSGIHFNEMTSSYGTLEKMLTLFVHLS